ncbi:MAG: hypothetical protein H7343_20230 [Undibacterium sp.]|nr:hypothetical protein [Opitutaceae bacterium]
MSKQRITNQAGFTLIEVGMASLILVVGFIGIIQAVTIGSQMIDTAQKQQCAIQLIDSEVEKLRSSSWTTVANLPSSASISVDYDGSVSGDLTRFGLTNFTATTIDDNSALLGMAKGFTLGYTVSYVRPVSATSATVTFIKIIYMVTWASNTNRSYSRSAEMYFGPNGLQLSFQKS